MQQTEITAQGDDRAGVRSRLPSFSVAEPSEDCLTLNVWTPATTGSRPVLVWLHGGAYLAGGSAPSHEMPRYGTARPGLKGN